jgi:hypothetical protein
LEDSEEQYGALRIFWKIVRNNMGHCALVRSIAHFFEDSEEQEGGIAHLLEDNEEQYGALRIFGNIMRNTTGHCAFLGIL